VIEWCFLSIAGVVIITGILMMTVLSFEALNQKRYRRKSGGSGGGRRHPGGTQKPLVNEGNAMSETIIGEQRGWQPIAALALGGGGGGDIGQTGTSGFASGFSGTCVLGGTCGTSPTHVAKTSTFICVSGRCM